MGGNFCGALDVVGDESKVGGEGGTLCEFVDATEEEWGDITALDGGGVCFCKCLCDGFLDAVSV